MKELPAHYAFVHYYLVHFCPWNSISLFVVVPVAIIHNVWHKFSYQPSYVHLCSGLSDLHERVKRISIPSFFVLPTYFFILESHLFSQGAHICLYGLIRHEWLKLFFFLHKPCLPFFSTGMWGSCFIVRCMVHC